MTLATSDSVIISSAVKKSTAKRNARLASTSSVASSPIARAIASSSAGDKFLITVGLVEAAWASSVAKLARSYAGPRLQIVERLDRTPCVTGPIVVDEFKKPYARHGIPYFTLTDNDMVFTTRFAGGKGGRNRYEVELHHLGVRQINSTPPPAAKSKDSTDCGRRPGPFFTRRDDDNTTSTDLAVLCGGQPALQFSVHDGHHPSAMRASPASNPLCKLLVHRQVRVTLKAQFTTK